MRACLTTSNGFIGWYNTQKVSNHPFDVLNSETLSLFREEKLGIILSPKAFIEEESSQ